MPRIDKEVDIGDTVIQQVLLVSVTPTLTMMEDDVAGEILKAGGQTEENAAPPVAFWDSWLYRSWKADRAMVRHLADTS